MAENRRLRFTDPRGPWGLSPWWWLLLAITVLLFIVTVGNAGN